jgi:hypothetical protein
MRSQSTSHRPPPFWLGCSAPKSRESTLSAARASGFALVVTTRCVRQCVLGDARSHRDSQVFGDLPLRFPTGLHQANGFLLKGFLKSLSHGSHFLPVYSDPSLSFD